MEDIGKERGDEKQNEKRKQEEEEEENGRGLAGNERKRDPA